MTRLNWKCLISRIFVVLTVFLLLAGCTPQAGITTIPTGTLAVNTPGPVTTGSTSGDDSAAASCALEPLVVPTMPAEIPGYAQLDSSIGLHITGNAQEIDPQSYRLKVSGLVDNPLELMIDELRCMPQVSDDPLLVCEGYFTDKATWSGVALSYVLDLAGVQPEADGITLVSADGYQVSLSLTEAKDKRNILAYEVNGETLPILHGFPLRAVIPMDNGNMWVKWLVEIQVE